MPETPSTMIPLGSIAPAFNLLDTVSGNQATFDELKSDVGTVIMFICNHCPFVKHVQSQLVQLAKDYQPKGISFIAISSNDVENFPDDAPDKMKSVAEEKGYSFPFLYDETQEIAKAYEAACTPDFFVFSGELKCIYRGRLDDSRPKTDIPVTGRDLRKVLDQLLSNQPISSDQIPSIGCNIKWKE